MALPSESQDFQAVRLKAERPFGVKYVVVVVEHPLPLATLHRPRSAVNFSNTGALMHYHCCCVCDGLKREPNWHRVSRTEGELSHSRAEAEMLQIFGFMVALKCENELGKGPKQNPGSAPDTVEVK